MSCGELYALVYNGQIDKVKDILSTGFDVNAIVNSVSGGTRLLHNAPNVEIAKELLLHGADINAKDFKGRTALHNAVSYRKELKLVKELLKNGADPNARSHQGSTALTLAIPNKNLDIIKELLEYGADINIPTTSPLLRYPTPLAIAVSEYKESAKVLIKIALLKNFDYDYKKVIHLDLYTECNNYNELSSYFDNCVCEIVQMKSEKANDKCSLYDFVLAKTECIKSLFPKYKDINIQLPKFYPIYHDVISEKINLFINRIHLLNKLTGIKICKNLDSSSRNDIFFNSDCLYKIAEFLCNDDLSRFTAAIEQD